MNVFSSWVHNGFMAVLPYIGGDGYGDAMRMLVIEDEAKVAKFIERGLMAERYPVDLAEDGRSGLELAISYHYDLVILDLMLPLMDGTEVLRRLRATNPN